MTITNRQKWEKFQEDYWSTFKFEYPSLTGEFDGSYQWAYFNESEEDYQRRYIKSSDFLNQLRNIEMQELPEADQISYGIVRQELDNIREQFELDGHLRPDIFPFGPEMLISYYAVDNMTLLSLSDAKDYVERMESFAKVFSDIQHRLQKGLEKGYVLPAVLLKPVINNISAYLGTDEEMSAWYKPFTSTLIKCMPGIDQLQAKAKQYIRNDIQPTYQNLINYLRDHYAPHCSEAIGCCDQPNGKAFYQYLIRYHTSLDIEPEDIYEIGLREVSRVQKEIATLAEDAGYQNNIDGFHYFMNNDPQFFARDKEDLKERFEVLSKRIDRRIPEFFGRIPRMTYGIEWIPEAMAAQRPVALAQASPADGTASGVNFITSLPERCPSHMHIPLALHEGWPGHLMHFALMQEIESLPMFRRTAFFNYNAYIEGWALYCEHLGLDMGLYRTPSEHYGRLVMEIWRAIRLVVDTGIHAKGWTRQHAISLMQEYLPFSKEVIEAEVDRYIGMPGQALSYKLGELKICELRQRAMNRLGDHFNLRDFHDCVLATGPVTLRILEQQVQRWINGNLHK